MLNRALFKISVALIAAIVCSTGVDAKEIFEGLWALTHADCADEEGPNSRTLIDLTNVVRGKSVPIFDQYENHCRIEKKAAFGDSLTLSVTCFEFWEEFEKGVTSRQIIVKLTPIKGGLEIDGKPYLRCATKRPKGR